MKVVIILLAFFISLLTSTGAQKCYKCEATAPINGTSPNDCSNPTEKQCVYGFDDVPETIFCMTFFKSDGKLYLRDCTSVTNRIFRIKGLNFLKKPGCQPMKWGNHNGIICLCNNKDYCNDLTSPTESIIVNGNTCKIVGMSLTTLLGGVLALSLIK